MGYCYDMRGRICCDACGDSGQTRKRTCPHKVSYPNGGSLPYCPAPALCSACYEKHKATLHQDCKEGAAKSTARYAAEAARVQSGDPQVKAAFGDWHEKVPKGFVGVLFEDKDRREIYKLMPANHYLGGGFLGDYTSAEPWPDMPAEKVSR
jgi:hypothetical protein